MQPFAVIEVWTGAALVGSISGRTLTLIVEHHLAAAALAAGLQHELTDPASMPAHAIRRLPRPSRPISAPSDGRGDGHDDGDDTMTPLARAEKFLNARLQWLERQLPLDGGPSPLWAEYVEALRVFTEVRRQLYGHVLGTRTERCSGTRGRGRSEPGAVAAPTAIPMTMPEARSKRFWRRWDAAEWLIASMMMLIFGVLITALAVGIPAIRRAERERQALSPAERAVIRHVMPDGTVCYQPREGWSRPLSCVPP